MSGKDFGINIGFVWLASELKESIIVENKMKDILQTIIDKL